MLLQGHAIKLFTRSFLPAVHQYAESGKNDLARIVLGAFAPDSQVAGQRRNSTACGGAGGGGRVARKEAGEGNRAVDQLCPPRFLDWPFPPPSLCCSVSFSDARGRANESIDSAYSHIRFRRIFRIISYSSDISCFRL